MKPDMRLEGPLAQAGNARLPIGVLIPTLNVRERLAGWLPALAPVLALAEEVVVDSYSEDGTLEFLRANLRHPRLRLLTHRRGLYQSWNFGLQQLRAKYAYCATAGEIIDVDGLCHLFEVAEALAVDVVVSPPEFYTLAGQAVPDKRWPIHDLLQWQAIRLPVRVAPVQVFLLSALETSECLLGSANCCATLKRTSALDSAASRLSLTPRFSGVLMRAQAQGNDFVNLLWISPPSVS